MEFISDPEKITAKWVNTVLEYAGIEAVADKITANSIGTGQVGENVRFTLSGSGDLPASIVGKFPSSDPVSRQTGIQLLNYKREVNFYKNLQATVAIQTPRVLYTEIDPATHDFVIIMEDLAPGIQGDQLTGCDIDVARLALTQLAHLHGPRWGDTSLIDGELITGSSSDSANTLRAFYGDLSKRFLNRYDARLSRDEKEMVSLVGENLGAYNSRYDGDLTLIHIDYRLDNMMFGGPYPLAVVDWQSINMGCALNDTAYFMGTSVDEKARGENEEALVRVYFETLSTYKPNLTWEDCWRYYRHHAPAGLIMAVIASILVGETERGNDMFMAMAKRSARMCWEMDAIGVIGG